MIGVGREDEGGSDGSKRNHSKAVRGNGRLVALLIAFDGLCGVDMNVFEVNRGVVGVEWEVEEERGQRDRYESEIRMYSQVT
jgi:hypothetical protein